MIRVKPEHIDPAHGVSDRQALELKTFCSDI